jgi:hypothetical protein
MSVHTPRTKICPLIVILDKIQNYLILSSDQKVFLKINLAQVKCQLQYDDIWGLKCSDISRMTLSSVSLQCYL